LIKQGLVQYFSVPQSDIDMQQKADDSVHYQFPLRGRMREIRFFPKAEIHWDNRLVRSFAEYDIYLDKGSCEFFYGTDGHLRLSRNLAEGGLYMTDVSLLRFDQAGFRFTGQPDHLLGEKLEYQGTFFKEGLENQFYKPARLNVFRKA